MASNYSPLTINRTLGVNLRAIQTTEIQGEDARQTLGELLQSALQLEFATIPTYLSAAFSLASSNRKISDLILRAAVEEMLHMTAVANLMNAIGIAPDIIAAVPNYPHHLTVLDPPLKLDLRSFSFDLVENLFMQIEAPEDPIDFPSVTAAADLPRTIGQFYAGIIDIIETDKIPGLFDNAVRDAYKQREARPRFKQMAYLNNNDNGRYLLKPEIDFRITDKVTAVRHLSWVVDQGEGSAPLDPLTSEGLPGHYYRFESIIKSRFLVKDENAQPLGYSFSGGDLPFDPAGVHEFRTNAKTADYGAVPAVQESMQGFNESYSSMINSLHQAFNCPAEDQQEQAMAAYIDALASMRNMPNQATSIIRNAKDNNVIAGVPFEFTGPTPTS